MRQTTTQLQKYEQGPLGLFRRFRKDEDGSLLYFGLLMFILILWFGGMAVDLMRYETTRAKLQGSLDRATLAAADLDQILPPADVVRDYLSKDNTLQFLQGEPDITEGINFRVVSIDAEVDMPLFFYDIPRVFVSPFTTGMTALTVSGTSTAEERVTDVEVSLVLDVSSSMDRNSRIVNMRSAARDFVTAVLANNTNAPNGLITISMIPYSAVVNPGPVITPRIESIIDRNHQYSSCLLFDDSNFTTTELDMSRTYDHVAHFGYNGYGSDWAVTQPWCFVGSENAIVPLTTNETTLHTAIDALDPWGNTAIDMGMKWGVALLDPSTRNLVTQLAGASGTGVPAIAAGRPEAYNQSDILKVIVLMTDGENTQQWDLVEPFKSGLSWVWVDLDYDTQPLEDLDSNEWSVQWSGHRTPSNYWDDRFFWNAYSSSTRWRDYPMGFSSQSDYVNYRTNNVGIILEVGQGPTYKNSARRASWQELFAVAFTSRVNNDFMSRARNDGAIPSNAGTYSGYDNGVPFTVYEPDFNDPDYALDTSVVNGSQADNRLSNICQAARDSGIVIYTVAFEAPYAGRTALRDCASSASHYFDVSGTDISEAFSAIASDIRALKLTR